MAKLAFYQANAGLTQLVNPPPTAPLDWSGVGLSRPRRQAKGTPQDTIFFRVPPVVVLDDAKPSLRAKKPTRAENADVPRATLPPVIALDQLLRTARRLASRQGWQDEVLPLRPTIFVDDPATLRTSARRRQATTAALEFNPNVPPVEVAEEMQSAVMAAARRRRYVPQLDILFPPVRPVLLQETGTVTPKGRASNRLSLADLSPPKVLVTLAWEAGRGAGKAHSPTAQPANVFALDYWPGADPLQQDNRTSTGHDGYNLSSGAGRRPN